MLVCFFFVLNRFDQFSANMLGAIVSFASAGPTKRKCDYANQPLLKQAKIIPFMQQKVATRMDVIERKNKKRPFPKIADGNKARSLMISWMRAAGKRFSPSKWLATLADSDRIIVKVAAGTTPKNISSTLSHYNEDYFLAGDTVYRLAKKSEPVFVKTTLVYTRTPNAHGAYSLTRDERTRADAHFEGDWEPATRMRGRGLVNTWKTTDGQLCYIPPEYQCILLRQVDIVAPPDRYTCPCVVIVIVRIITHSHTHTPLS